MVATARHMVLALLAAASLSAHASQADPRREFCAAARKSFMDYPITALNATSGPALTAENRVAISNEIARSGWPSMTVLGREQIDALVHTIEVQSDAGFKESMVNAMAPCIGVELDARYISDFNDRLEMANGRPQQFGTQYVLKGRHAELAGTVDLTMIRFFRGLAALPTVESQTERVNQQLQSGRTLEQASAVPLRPTLEPLTDQPLRVVLIDWQIEDQQVSSQIDSLLGAKGAAEQIQALKDHQHALTERAKGMWQSRPLANASAVGTDGVTAIWLQVQHSDDHVWMAAQAGRLRELMDDGSLRRDEYALFVDRLDVQEGRPQRYGSQFHTDNNGQKVPDPIVDPDHLDERRASMNLGPWAEYAKQMEQPPQHL